MGRYAELSPKARSYGIMLGALNERLEKDRETLEQAIISQAKAETHWYMEETFNGYHNDEGERVEYDSVRHKEVKIGYEKSVRQARGIVLETETALHELYRKILEEI